MNKSNDPIVDDRAKDYEDAMKDACREVINGHHECDALLAELAKEVK